MRITSVTLSNIKSFREATPVALNPALNILVGPNGGGKSNLLDSLVVLLRFYFLKGWYTDVQNDEHGSYRRVLEGNLFSTISQHLPRFAGENAPVKAEITFRVGSDELTAMRSVNDLMPTLRENLQKYRNWQGYGASLSPFKIELFNEGDELTYRVDEYNLVQNNATEAEREYLRHLQFHELHVLLAGDSGITLPAQMLYFSPFRGAAATSSFEANLPTTNRSELKRNYQQATSRTNTSLLQLASLHFGAKRRHFEALAADHGFKELWDADAEVVAVTTHLARVGYSWSLEASDPVRNIFRIILRRGGVSFDISQASTGEQELINYLFGLFAFALRGGLLIVDEVELHLHPRWQVLLLDLLSTLGDTTRNQIVVSTHSPAFITPQSVRNVTRVYRDETRTSRVKRLEGDETSVRDMLHVVNSHNNERMFFADRVVLVEGVMDRLLFDALIQRQLRATDGGNVVEVLEVHGKGNFDRYVDFLNRLGVAWRVVADQDYLKNVAEDHVGQLFVTDWSAIDQQTLNAKRSEDRATLAQVMEHALATADLESVRQVWVYVKSRRSRLKSPLSEAETESLTSTISDLRTQMRFVLRHGEIEDYLPEGSRDLDGVIALTIAPSFEEWLGATGNTETTRDLMDIVRGVLA